MSVGWTRWPAPLGGMPFTRTRLEEIKRSAERRECVLLKHLFRRRPLLLLGVLGESFGESLSVVQVKKVGVGRYWAGGRTKGRAVGRRRRRGRSEIIFVLV